MLTTKIILQVLVALGIFNVWLLRFDKPTAWRGAASKNMKQEFTAYGLPVGLMYGVGLMKLISAALLLVGLWYPIVIMPAAGLIAALMIGAVAMHFKIGDAPMKSLPATSMLLFCIVMLVS
jgi:hypothetical protein